MITYFWTYNNLIILISLLSILNNQTIIGQTSVDYNENYNKYRIVAYQNPDEQIFSISNVVSVEKPYVLYSPNSFSPDGDGINDFFGIRGQGITDFQIEIFNRWGQMVFKSHSIDDKWDGTFKNKALPTGTYIYKVKTTSYGDEQLLVKSGTISLVR